MHNRDYKKELKSEPVFHNTRKCPKCSSRIVALPPDRAWCENKECNYGEEHLIGNGVYSDKGFNFQPNKIL